LRRRIVDELMPTDDDHDLLYRLRDGDALAFAELDRRYRRRLTAFAARLLGSAHDAEDVVQEAMVRAFDRLPAEMYGGELSAWLHRVVRNACLDQLRHRQRTVNAINRLATERGGAEDAHVAAVRRAELATVVDDLQRLPERQREAVVLACVDGLRHAEVAERLESSVPATKSLLLRARANLTRMARVRDGLAALAPLGKLAAMFGGAAPAAVLSLAAIGTPIVLIGAGRVVAQHTVVTSEPAPRRLDYGPFTIDHGAPLPDGVRLEEATVELPAGESAPRVRRLAITCPQGFVQAGLSTGSDPTLDRLELSGTSSRRIGEIRRGVILFRPKPDLARPRTVGLGIECVTPEYWQRVGAVYPDWAECQAIRTEVRRRRDRGEPVPPGLLRARHIDCGRAQREIRSSGHLAPPEPALRGPRG
jgi:RNA polymerase sigma factor (sigma-70 family)